jgi:hypothetical protein
MRLFLLTFSLFGLAFQSKFNSLYQESLKTLLPQIVKGEFDFNQIGSFYASDQQTAILLIGAILTKHLLSYDPYKFQLELSEMGKYRFLEQILPFRPIDLMKDNELLDLMSKSKLQLHQSLEFQTLIEMSLYHEFCMFGLFRVLSRSINPLILKIRESIKFVLKKSFPKTSRTFTLQRFILNVDCLCQFSDLNELCINLVNYILQSPNFDKNRTLEILNLQDVTNLGSFLTWSNRVLLIDLYYKTLHAPFPFEIINKIFIERGAPKNEFSELANGKALLNLITLPTKTLIATVSKNLKHP